MAILRFEFLAALAIPFALGACSAEQPPAGQTHLQGFACTEGPYALRLARDYQKLKSLPGFLSETIYKPETELSPKTRALNFKGLTVGLVTPARGVPPLWGYVHISSPDWNIGAPIRVGAPAGDLSKLLGKGRMADGEWRFAGEGADTLLVVLKEGKVSDVVYECYSG